MIHKVIVESSVYISEDDSNRYWLKRVWDKRKGIGVFIALNPSKATELVCDQTMCNMNNLSLQWSWGGFYILNLFAYRSTDSRNLEKANNPIGEENDIIIHDICGKHNPIVLAGGEEKPRGKKERAHEVKSILRKLNKEVHCLSENAESGYRHPSRNFKLEDYPQPVKTDIN